MDRFAPALGMHGGSVHGRMIEVYRAFNKGGDSWAEFRPGVTVNDKTTNFQEDLDEQWMVKVQVWVSPLRRELAQDFMHEESGEVSVAPVLAIEDGA